MKKENKIRKVDGGSFDLWPMCNKFWYFYILFIFIYLVIFRQQILHPSLDIGMVGDQPVKWICIFIYFILFCFIVFCFVYSFSFTLSTISIWLFCLIFIALNKFMSFEYVNCWSIRINEIHSFLLSVIKFFAHFNHLEPI